MVVALIMFTLTIYLVYLMYRNGQVCVFRKRVIELCTAWSNSHISEIVEGNEKSALDWLYEEMSDYDEMLFSFKPLKFKYWIPKEKLDKVFNKI